jgi:hypothetical protein
MKRSRTYRLGVVVALALLAAAGAAHAQPCAPDGASSPCLGGRGIRYCVNGAWGECRIETCESFSGTTLSDGPAVTAEDLAQFDRKWAGDHAGRSCLARQRLAERCDPCVWEIFDRMHALIRMYDLTHDQKFVVQLRDLVEHAFQFRDDRHPGRVEVLPACASCDDCVAVDLPPRPLDLARQKVVPGWGGKSPNSGGLHGVSVGDSALYAHAMAAFARIVLENPGPLAPYLGDAVRHANAVIETVYAFLPDIAYRERGGQVEAYLLSGLPSYRTPTPQQCSDAYAEELARIKREVARAEWPEAEGRARSMLNNCRTAPRIGPLQHNINLSFAMVLIELSRALESPSYRQSPQRSNDAEPARVLAPVLVARLHRYFVNNLHTVTDAPGRSRFVWNFSDDVPTGIDTHPEDASHGALDMRYVELIARDRDRLSRLAAAAAPGESISFDETYLRRFANTFLQKLVQGRHLAHDVTGRAADPIDQWDGMCDGWVVLAAADPEVYEVCREMTLRAAFRNPGCVQPNLNMSNHAALLAHKRFASRPSPPPPPPPVEVPDVVGLTPNRAATALRQAGLVPRFTPGGTSVRSQAPRAGAFVPRGSEVRCVTQREPVQ